VSRNRAESDVDSIQTMFLGVDEDHIQMIEICAELNHIVEAANA
jgi:hypothetical protein